MAEKIAFEVRPKKDKKVLFKRNFYPFPPFWRGKIIVPDEI